MWGIATARGRPAHRMRLLRLYPDWRRSHALILLMLWRQHNLLTDEEFAAFSPETRAAVEAWQQSFLH